MLDHNLEAILVDQKKRHAFIHKLDPNSLDKGLMDQTITLDGLLNILLGGSGLFSTCLLVPELKGVTLLTAADNLRFSTILAQVFGDTLIDPFAGVKPLLKPGQDNRNKITHLRHGRYYLSMLLGISSKDGGNHTAWTELRPRFTQNAMRVLDHVRNNLNGLLIPDPFPTEAAQAIHHVFCYLHELDETQTAPSAQLYRRELAMLFVEALLGHEDIDSAVCRQWVMDGHVSQIPKREIHTDERLDSLSKYFGSGVFALERKEIQESLLPDIKVRKANREQVFQLQPRPGAAAHSPLERILALAPAQNLFLLCGEDASGMSGAGKTTSMRTLYYNNEEQAPIFVPLYALYSANSLRTLPLEGGTFRLLPWLTKQNLCFGSLQDLAPRLILLDGLDEITDPRGLQSLCDDLRELADCHGLRIVISSKLPPEKLASWNQLKCISSVWNRCMRCYIQPLRTEQKTAYVQDLPLPMQSTLTTPFLLRIYKEVQTFLSGTPEQTSCALRARWLSERQGHGELRHEAAIFYRYLVVQICRWFDANRANDAQNEADAFFLMHALPAVAFQMEVSRMYDQTYTPEARPVDNARAEGLLNQSFPALKRALTHYAPYRENMEPLLSSLELLNKDGFDQGQAVTVLHRERDPETLELNLRFVNHAIQENLAALHLANLLFSASHNALIAREAWLDFYTCPAYFLPQPLWKKAFHFSNELFSTAWTGEGNSGFSSAQVFLERGFDSLPSEPLSRYLLCSLAAGMCGALNLPEKLQWQWAAENAYLHLLEASPEFAAKYRMDHILSLCAQAQALRLKQPEDAAKKARDAISFHKAWQEMKNSDGYHALAKVYLEQVEHILNQDCGNELQILPIPEEELKFSDQIYEELARLAQIQGTGEGRAAISQVFGSMPKENLALTAPLLQILDKARLRLDCYGEKAFFGSDTLRFLLTASYTAKAHCIYAAISRGTSGAALNMLGCFLENNQEELENHPELPFFLNNPHLHLPLDSAQLTYTDGFLNAFRVFHRIYSIKRGPQPYSARKLAQALLARRVRLDEQGQPVDGPGTDAPFTPQEHAFLHETTRRACVEPRPGHAIPRIRYLNEYIQTTSGSADSLQSLTEEVRMLFQREWELCACSEKLYSGKTQAPDLNAALLSAEYMDGYLDCCDFSSWATRLCTFFRQQLGLGGQPAPAILYTTGTRMQKLYLSETWYRLCRLSGPAFPIHPRDGANPRWCEIAQHLQRP